MRVGWVNDWGSRATVRYSFEYYTRFFQSHDIESEVFSLQKKYDFVFFVKTYYPDAQALAQFLKKNGVKVFLFNSVNYYETWGDYPAANVLPSHTENIHKMTEIVDATINVSPFIKETADKYFPSKNYFIHEPIDINKFRYQKIKRNEPPRFVFCSTVNKCNALLLIKDVLKRWLEKLQTKLYIISDNDPMLNLTYEFIPWINDENCASRLSLGDIFLAPRKINSYDFGHSITKIGQAMSVGIPAIASPLSSYQTSPATLCKTIEDWNIAIEKHLDIKYWNQQSKKQSQWVKANCSIEVCGQKLLSIMELYK
jgi:glycosyltransferase involved in cell wall biosynthesis